MIGAVRGAPYLAQFALREPPFASNAGPRFFYADAARQQCLDMLHHLAEYSEEWLLVSGPAGIGKSTLLDEFIRRANPHLRPCRLDGGATGDGAQLFLQIAGAFGLDLARHPEGDPLEQLRAHLNMLHAEQVPLVAVDDADRLTDDALEIILHLADLDGDHGRLIRVVLFSDATLQERLATPRFAAISRPHLLALLSFDEADTARYLVHRMSVAGYEGANPFDAAAVKSLFKESGGVPGAINRCADQLLRQRMGGERAAGRGWGRRALLPLAGVAAVTGLVVALHGFFGGTSEPVPSVAVSAPLPAPAAPPSIPSSGPVVMNDGVPPVPAAEAQPPQHATDAEASVPEAAQAVTAPPPESPSAPAAAESAPPVPAPALAKVHTTPLSGAAWFQAQDPARYTLQLLAAGQMASVNDFIKSHPPEGPWAVVDTRRDGAPFHLVVAGSFATHAEAEAAAARLKGLDAWPRLFRDLMPKEEAKDPTGLKNGQWIASRDPERYTLQLVAAEHRQAVLNQLGDAPLPGPTALFATDYHGRSLFVAVYGDYPDASAAEHAFHSLPPRLRQGTPLVREFGTLQESLTPKPGNAPSAN